MEQKMNNKEYTIWKIFSESWKYFKENFQIIFLIVLAVCVPINILLICTPLSVLFKEHGLPPVFEIYAIIILFSLVKVIASIVLILVTQSTIDKTIISFGQVLRKSISRWPAALGTYILLSIFLSGLFLLVVPGIIYYVYWIFMLCAVTLRDKSGIRALSYSRAIVKGRWWKVAGYALVFGLLGSLIGTSLVEMSARLLPHYPVVEVVAYTLTDIARSFFVVVSVVFFVNFDNTRKEMVTTHTR